jgi:hypothetical protein
MPDFPKLTAAKSAERVAREARLAGALRDNLRRRKEQARARAAERDASNDSAEPSVPQSGDSGPTG